MELKIIKLDPLGVEEQEIIIDTEINTEYHRFLIEINGVKYMLTKDEAKLWN